jgi:hypothetical protein
MPKQYFLILCLGLSLLGISSGFAWIQEEADLFRVSAASHGFPKTVAATLTDGLSLLKVLVQDHNAQPVGGAILTSGNSTWVTDFSGHSLLALSEAHNAVRISAQGHLIQTFSLPDSTESGASFTLTLRRNPML